MSHTHADDATPRGRILARLRGALADAPAAHTPPAATAVASHYAGNTPNWPLTERLTRLVNMMQSVQTEVHLVRESDWPARLAWVVGDKGVRQILLAPQTTHGDRAARALQQAGSSARIRAFDRDIEHWKAELFTDIDAGFTTVRSAIAATGSLILWPDADEPRTVSLVPPLHIALLDGRKVHTHFHEAMTAEGWAAVGMPTNALLVSGPSKTSDIQQTLAYGAHGPRALVLLLIVPDEVDLTALATATGAYA